MYVIDKEKTLSYTGVTSGEVEYDRDAEEGLKIVEGS